MTYCIKCGADIGQGEYLGDRTPVCGECYWAGREAEKPCWLIDHKGKYPTILVGELLGCISLSTEAENA